MRTPLRNRLAVVTREDGHVSLLDGASRRDVTRFYSLTCELQVDAGRVLAREGGQPSGFCVVVDGLAVGTAYGMHIARFGRDSFFGEAPLVDRVPEPLSVTATTPMTVRVASATEFRDLLGIDAVANAVLSPTASRHRELLRSLAHDAHRAAS